jgi:Rrf2 family transcriptional regulator, nitric oxide-sensitive transcriptional repressor
MKLTVFTDYSLRVLIYLAAQPGRRATVAEIATAYGIKQNHLTKVVHFLGRHGWLATVRGKGGGLELARPAQQIAIGELLRQTEGQDLPAECFDKASNTCPITRVCRLKTVLHEAAAAFHAVLDQYTLADLVHNPRPLNALLFVPPARSDARPARGKSMA